MKKILVYLFATLSLLIGGTVLAQSAGDSGSSDPGNPNASDLWDLKIRFCDGTGSLEDATSLFINTQWGKEEEICIYVQNTWPTPMKVAINFVDGWYTQGSNPKKACQPEETKGMFGQYVTSTNNEFEIYPNGAFETRVKLQFPVGYAGLVNWCVTTRIVKDGGTESAVKVIARRANFIDVFVDGEFKVNMSYEPFSENSGTYKNISNNELIGLYQRINDDRYTTRFTLKNNGNVPVISTSDIKATIFWFITKEWNDVTSKISSSGSTYIDVDMPSYLKWLWWLTKVSIKSNYTADVDQSMPNYEELTSENYDIQTSATAFITPWWLMILIAFILLIILVSRRWNKKDRK